MAEIASQPAAGAARRLVRGARSASLATALVGDGWPYCSLVLLGLDHDATPVLLLSNLAEHTRNIKADDRVSLLVDAAAGASDPLASARVSVLGRARLSQTVRHRDRFLARHPEAAAYAGFADFAFYEVAVTRAHMVAGFGRIHWLNADEFRYRGPAEAIAEAEASILAHMNSDHGETIQLYATALSASGEGWTMVGCDPEGCDLKRAERLLRLDFAQPAETADAVRAELVRLARAARGQGAEG